MFRLSALRRPTVITTILVVALACATGFLLSIGDVQGQENLTEKLGGDNRYLTHIALDKPIYRPGETMYLRTTVLHAFRKTPYSGWLGATLKIIGPDGSTRLETRMQGEDSVLATRWKIPADLAGGQYTAEVLYAANSLTIARRSFEIRAFRQRRMRMQIDLDRKAYGPGEEVAAELSVTRSEGGVPTSASFTAVARVDGSEVWRTQAPVGDGPSNRVSFTLPAKIEDGSGTLTFIVSDGGMVESLTKTLPILLQRMNVAIYPEGGDFVAGMEQGFYVEASTPWDEPADIAAAIVDTATGTVVGHVATSHEGRGRGRFTPQAGASYELRINRPAGIREAVALPEVKPEGVVMQVAEAVVGPDEPVVVSVTSTSEQTLRITLSRIEQEVSALSLPFKAGVSSQLMLTPPGSADGVLRLTVSDQNGTPLAERLIFRRPRHGLNLEVVAPQRVLPGSKAEVTLRATDHAGKAVKDAVLGITVTDDAVLEMIERRKQTPRLPTMVLLEAEVQRLEDATVYLGNDATSRLALDLLLGTQGWRRFIFKDVDAFTEAHPDAAPRVLAQNDTQVLTTTLGVPAGVLRGFEGGDGGAEEAEEGVAERAGVDADNAPHADEPVANDAKPNKGGQAGEADKKAAADDNAEEAKARAPAPNVPAEDPAPKRRDQAFDEDDDDNEVREFRQRRANQGNSEVFREYAFKARQHRKVGDRSDFTETLYWAAAKRTNEKGEVTFSFDTSDSITSFRVMADGFSQGGQLGTADALIESVQPFAVEVKLPLEVTAGDSVTAPISVINETNEARTIVLSASASDHLELGWIPREGVYSYTTEIAARSRISIQLPLTVGRQVGSALLTLTATGGDLADTITRTIAVAPKGFPVSHNYGGMLDNTAPQSFTVAIPDSVEPTSIRASANVYPTPLANLTQALESLIRQPYGCFEQTSSVVYPMVMAQQYFQSHVGVDPALIARADKFIADGYNKLVGFECQDGGFEWFGSGPGHEALTAYGIVEFMDIAKVQGIDDDMLARTRKWLENRRDGKGGFLRNQQALDSFGGAPDDITNAYIVWSLTREGAASLLKPEIDALREQAKTKTDAYFRGLVCGILYNIGEREAASNLARELASMQDKDGSVAQAATSITRSTGRTLAIECTAISILNWLNDDAQFAANTENAMLWLTSQIQDGRFASTQATVLALKAIVDYDKARATPKADGTFAATINGQPLQSAFTKDTRGVVSLDGLQPMLSATGTHHINLGMQQGSRMPFSLSVEYYAETPATSPNAPVTMDVSIANPRLTEGESADINLNVRNVSGADQGMVMVIVGMPGGLEVRHDKLRELVQAGTIGFYEVIGRDVALYLRAMKSGEKLKLSFDAAAAVPGTYFGPASRSYAYYNDDAKFWVTGLACEITAKP